MTGKIIAITGVTHGIGRAMAEEFTRLGHRVFGCGRSKKEIKALNRSAQTAGAFSVVDVSVDNDVCKWAASVLKQAGAPHLILNNAGVINRNARAWELSAEEFDEVLRVNVSGVANVIRRPAHRASARSNAGRHPPRSSGR